jgi:hypothetical protein
MYQNTTAEFRPELLVAVQEAMAADRKFIADSVFPVYGVNTRTGYYKRIKKGGGALLATEGSDGLVRAPGTPYKQVSRKSDQDNWKCVDRGLKEPMDDVNNQEESRFYDVESSTSIWLARNIRISREQRVAARIQDQTVWGKIDAGEEYLEANLATIDFAKDLRAAKRLIEKRQEDPNTLVISRELWDLITITDKLRLYLFGSLQGNSMITPQQIAEKFELKQVLIGSASYSTAKKGKDVTDDDLAWCWGNSSFWVGQVTEGAPEAGGAGRTIVLEDTTNGGELQVVETYRDEDLRSDILRVREDTDEKVINENSGIIVKVTGLS